MQNETDDNIFSMRKLVVYIVMKDYSGVKSKETRFTDLDGRKEIDLYNTTELA